MCLTTPSSPGENDCSRLDLVQGLIRLHWDVPFELLLAIHSSLETDKDRGLHRSSNRSSVHLPDLNSWGMTSSSLPSSCTCKMCFLSPDDALWISYNLEVTILHGCDSISNVVDVFGNPSRSDILNTLDLIELEQEIVWILRTLCWIWFYRISQHQLLPTGRVFTNRPVKTNYPFSSRPRSPKTPPARRTWAKSQQTWWCTGLVAHQMDPTCLAIWQASIWFNILV